MDRYANFNDIPVYLRRKKKQKRKIITLEGLYEAVVLVAFIIVVTSIIITIIRVSSELKVMPHYSYVLKNGIRIPYKEFCEENYQLCNRA